MGVEASLEFDSAEIADQTRDHDKIGSQLHQNGSYKKKIAKWLLLAGYMGEDAFEIQRGADIKAIQALYDALIAAARIAKEDDVIGLRYLAAGIAMSQSERVSR